MWYDAPQNNDSPGSVVATAVGDLYRQLQANPEQYPRGLTVRILLGNPPELALGETTGQLWTLLNDLRTAGVDKMVDETLGWRLEVADFAGVLPHSHVKSVVIDGRTSVAAGFNMSYDHFPLDHVSGRGQDRFDIAIQITGPMAQASQRAFDDLWQGADERVCLELSPPLGLPWQVTCYDRTAVADHLPETQKFYLMGENSTAFSLYRSRVLPMADRQTEDVLAMAQTRIDATHVMFSLDMICSLNLLFQVCNYENGPYYIDALLQAVENGAHIRLMLKGGPSEGIENNVALTVFLDRVAELGRSDQVEVRFFSGSFHPKAALVDDQVLVIGSQNFHYSAYGTGRGLAEYSIAVEDERAVEEFRRAFEVEWDTSNPRTP
jgi:phosphatidylserine/phosphatidylglycerophosphate/cardiolipin synthase-like enzyme